MLALYAHQSWTILRKVHHDSFCMSSMHYVRNDLLGSNVLSQQCCTSPSYTQHWHVQCQESLDML
jgi:hypothetical protein